MFLLLLYASRATVLLEGREGVPKNFERAFALASFGAEFGCPHCKGVLARCFLAGYGCQLDLALAERLAQESADVGSRYGLYVLGYLAYEKGRVVAAKTYWQKAADLGLAVAQFNLASLLVRVRQSLRTLLEIQKKEEHYLELCRLIQQLDEESFLLYLEASKTGYPSAWQELGVMFHYGIAVYTDMSLASQCFAKARKAGIEYVRLC
jgi:TPR repeat protein